MVLREREGHRVIEDGTLAATVADWAGRGKRRGPMRRYAKLYPRLCYVYDRAQQVSRMAATCRRRCPTLESEAWRARAWIVRTDSRGVVSIIKPTTAARACHDSGCPERFTGPAAALAGGVLLYLAGDVAFRRTLGLGSGLVRAVAALGTIPLGKSSAALANVRSRMSSSLFS